MLKFCNVPDYWLLVVVVTLLVLQTLKIPFWSTK